MMMIQLQVSCEETHKHCKCALLRHPLVKTQLRFAIEGSILVGSIMTIRNLQGKENKELCQRRSETLRESKIDVVV